jgi:hypothetical protein
MSNEKNLGDGLIAQLKKTAGDLEEFQVQLALGKAEAKEKLIELKKKLDDTVLSAKQKLAEGKKLFNEMRGELEELMVQLVLGKAETLEMFEEQKKIIISGIKKLIKQLEALGVEIDIKFKIAIDKFTAQLDVVRVKYSLGKMDAMDAFEKEKRKLRAAIAKMKAGFEPKRKTSTT